MKVTVCFGSIRVVVPCGSGDLLVAELIEKSIVRYRKAIGKPSDYWVNVHNFKSSSDGGILDPDDHLNDVADDREQIIALYEEQDPPPVPHNGDGTSASSVGTASPDIFTGSTNAINNDKTYLPVIRQGGKNDVIITQNDLSMGSGLIVRRGSEPVLTNIGTTMPNEQPPPEDNKSQTGRSNLKRWSAIASIDESKLPRDDDHSGQSDDDEDSNPPFRPTRIGGSGAERGSSAFSRFARDSTRQSLASNNSAVYRWFEAQEEEEYRQIQMGRKEPLGGSGSAEDDVRDENKENQDDPRSKGTLVCLKNTGGPLGIHVVPDYDSQGSREMGLVIQGIEPGGRIYSDHRIQVHDRIVEINGTSLVDVDFTTAKEIFKHALQTDGIQLRIVKHSHGPAPPPPKNPPPVHAKPSSKKKPNDLKLITPLSPIKSDAGSPFKDSPTTPSKDGPGDGDSKPGSPTKRVPPAVPARHPSTTLTSPTKAKLAGPVNTRKKKKVPTATLR